MDLSKRQRGRRKLALLLLVLTAAAAAAAWAQGIASRGVSSAPRPRFSGRPWASRLVDVSERAGFTVPTQYGSDARIEQLVESSGGGLGVIDFDRDGRQDLFVVNGAGGHHRLYRNRGGGAFEDVSVRAGLARLKPAWGMGVATGDYDGDGFDDLYVTQWGQDLLLRNDSGGGTFSDVTARVGLARAAERWGAGAAFLDYDRDGDLDLFVTNYLDADPAATPKPGANPNCVWKGIAVACGPRGLKPGRLWLYRFDKPAGRYTDVTASAGILAASRTYAMTAIAADFDDDGWTDLYVASDSSPSLYFRNLRNGRFAEEGLERAVAVNEDGREQAGMGVGVGDVNRDGRLDLFKTHFAEDTPVLYLGRAASEPFADATLASGLGVETRYVGWGAGLDDLDNDGWPDAWFVTGHVYPDIERALPAYPYRTPMVLFRNLGEARFEQIAPDVGGEALGVARPSRGAVAFDFDNDGDLDLAIWNRNSPVTLLQNDLAAGARWIQFEAPLGTRVTVQGAARVTLSQSSFYSAPGRVLHFGLGGAAAGVTMDAEVRLPGRPPRVMRGLAVNQRHRLTTP